MLCKTSENPTDAGHSELIPSSSFNSSGWIWPTSVTDIVIKDGIKLNPTAIESKSKKLGRTTLNSGGVYQKNPTKMADSAL